MTKCQFPPRFHNTPPNFEIGASAYGVHLILTYREAKSRIFRASFTTSGMSLNQAV